MIKLILVLFMASAMPASAGPVIAAIAMSLGASFATGIAISTFFGTVVGRVLLSVALSALKQVLAPKSKSGQSSGIQTNITQTGADQSVSWVMGKYATAGVMVCPPMTHGKVDKTPNAYLTYVVNLSDIPGMTLSRVAINGVWVTFSGTADADFGTPAVGEYAGYAWVKYYNGSQIAADPGLLAKYASYPDRPWASDMIGLETCYAIMTFRIKSELYSGFPTVLFEVSGIPLYDPRKDTTVGGSGAHRWATRSTWEPSNNPFVQVYNILRGIQISATEYWGGQAEAADVPLTTWMTAMNACDAAITLAAGGTEPAYRSGLEVFVKDEPASVIEQLLKGCAGDVCDIGGVWKARAGGVSLPVYTFTDDDVIITQSSTFDPFPAGLSGVYNAAVATYPEPISTYEIETSPQMLFPTFETEDRGQRLPASLSLPSVPYTNQVQRLCDAYVRDNRRFRRHSVPMPPAAMLLEPLDATAWTSTVNGYSGKVFEVEEIRDDIMSGIQGVSVRERDPADYSWSSTRELPTDPRPFTLVLPVAQSVPSWAVTGVSLVDAGSTARRPALRLAWNGSEQDDIAGIEFEIRLTGTVNVAHRASTTLLDASVFDYSAGILPNVSYEARGRFLSDNARNWSSWVSATTPDTGFTDSDFGTTGAYTSLFTSQGLYAIRDVTVLPGSGAFVGEKVLNRTDGKLYQWDGAAWALVVAAAGPGTVTTASFAAGIAPVEILGALPTTGNFQGRTVFLTTDKKMYRHTGSPIGSAGFTRVTDGADLTPATLTAAAFAATIAPVEIFATLPTTGNYAGRTVFLSTDNKLYRHTGSPVGAAGFTAAVPAVDISGQIVTGQIADAALTAAKFAATIAPVEIFAALPTTGNYAGRTVFLTTNNKLYRHTGSPVGSAGFTLAVDGADLTPATLTAAAFAANIAPVEIFATLPTTGNYAGRTVFLSTDSKLYRYNGTAFTAAVAGADIVANSITAGQIAAGAIGATQIAAGAILASKIVVSDFANIFPDFDMLDTGYYASSTGAAFTFAGVTAGSLGRNAMLIPALAGVSVVESNWFPLEASTEYLVSAAAWLLTSAVGSGTVTVTFETGSMAAGGVITGLTSDVIEATTDSTAAAPTAVTIITGSTARRGRFVTTRAAGGTASGRSAGFKCQKKGTGSLTVDGTITGAKIAANTITAGNIAANTITAGQIAALTITSAKLAAGSVIAGKIAAGTIVAGDIAANTITAGQIAANTITAGQIAAGTISATEIAALAITSGKLAAGAVIAGKIAAGTIVAADIAADTITAGQIAAGAISTSELAAGAVTATKIAAGTITANEILANTITGGLLAASGIITATAQIGNGLITNALISGAIQSTSYVPGVSGWKIDKAGSAEFANLVVRGWIQNNAVTDTLLIADLPQLSYASNSVITYISMSTGTGGAHQLWRCGAAFEARVSAASMSIALEWRRKYAGVWGPWIRKSTTTIDTAWDMIGMTFNFTGAYDNTEMRLINDASGTSATLYIQNVRLTASNTVK